MKLENYESIIDSSTEHFKKRHLILDKDIRSNVNEMCSAILGNRNECNYNADVNDAFSNAVSFASGHFALERLKLLARQGLFSTNDESGDDRNFDDLHVSYYDTYSDTNSIIVQFDTIETVILHISQGYPEDLCFRIEKKSSLDGRNHLKWKDGKISHFQS